RESGVEWLPTWCGPSPACSQRVEPGLHEAQTAFAAASRAPRTRDSLIGHGKQQPHYRCGEDLRAGVVRRQPELPGQAARDRPLGYAEQPAQSAPEIGVPEQRARPKLLEFGVGARGFGAHANVVDEPVEQVPVRIVDPYLEAGEPRLEARCARFRLTEDDGVLRGIAHEDRPRRDIRAFGDLVDRRPVEALLEREFQRCALDCLARASVLAFAEANATAHSGSIQKSTVNCNFSLSCNYLVSPQTRLHRLVDGASRATHFQHGR